MPTSSKGRKAGSRTKVAKISKGKKIFDGRKALYKGDYHRLEFVPSYSQRIRVHDRIIVLPDYARINLKQVLKDWMKKETEKLVEKRLEQFGRKMKLISNGFSIRDTRKWAYRTKYRRIVFDPQLIALHGELADYVIMRELTRLKEFSHSKSFTHALALIVPDFKERELSLKRYITE